jgi:hypothetical protein
VFCLWHKLCSLVSINSYGGSQTKTEREEVEGCGGNL